MLTTFLLQNNTIFQSFPYFHECYKNLSENEKLVELVEYRKKKYYKMRKNALL